MVVIHELAKYCARAILDCGSQRTQAGIVTPYEHGRNTDIRFRSGLQCEVEVITKNGHTLGLSALVVPYICEVTVGPPIHTLIKNHPYMTDLDNREIG